MFISMIGNYQESLKDAEAARKFQPNFIKAVERGKEWSF